MQIKTKAQFYRLWEAGLLGNKLRTWRDYREAYDAGVPSVGFREIGAAGGGKLDIVKREDIGPTAFDWEVAGRAYMICETAPDHRGTLQGEVIRTERGLQGMLGLSTGKRMREAIALGLLKPRSYVETVVLLRQYMDEGSRETLERLMTDYPDAAVEFTCYEIPVGPERLNTIFWETRNY